jgi:AAA family ATP:ADP antiporter
LGSGRNRDILLQIKDVACDCFLFPVMSMARYSFSIILKRLGQVKQGEGVTAVLMFSYSFFVMTSYSIVKPITRSKFIVKLGAENLPYVQLTAGILIGVIMLGYSWLIARLPRRWGLPIIQAGIGGLLIGFWFLFREGGDWVSIAFYLLGLLLGLLLISQFWTLANLIYDARQAKRLFGFVGAGAPLGGITGSVITAWWVQKTGSNYLLLVSAFFMFACVAVVVAVIMRESLGGQSAFGHVGKGLGLWQALDLLKGSKHLQTIALVMSFAAVGAAIIEQQLNMAAEATKGQESAIAGFLALLQALTSTFGFLIQLLLTSRIHRFLGIGFALMILPIGLGSTATVMLFNAALWAPGLARVLDQSLRYTVDKTTREILFMPLPGDTKIKAKTFMDVSVDRFAKGLAAVLILVLIKPWGLNLNWQKIGYASLTITALWIVVALRAKRGYLRAFRSSMEARSMRPSETRHIAADMLAMETLVEELAHEDERRVLYAIDILESLDKKNLVTPLILNHTSPAVRIRALTLLKNPSTETSRRWLPFVRRLMNDPDTEVRVAAFGALAGMTMIDATEFVRPYVADKNPRIALTAAMVLTRSENSLDKEEAENVLRKYGASSTVSSNEARKELAKILGYIPDARFCRLLIPLLTDNDFDVCQEAMRSVRHVGPTDFIFVPALVPLLRHPRLKAGAREILVGYGQEVLDVLHYFLCESNEDISVRRQIPATIAHIPCRKAADILMSVLEDADDCLRSEAIIGLERLKRQTGLDFGREPVERQLMRECEQQIYHANLYRQCFGDTPSLNSYLLARAVRDKTARGIIRIFRLMGLIFPWKDVAAARWSIEIGGPCRAHALEYLDNLLPVNLRRRILPVLEQHLEFETAAKAEGKSRVGSDCEKALRTLMHDDDPVISATAIHMICQRKLEQFGDALEHILKSRHARNRCIFEAASWALWTLRRPEDWNLAHWTEPIPAIEIAARLNRLSLFSSVSVDGLFRIAQSGRQIRYIAGETFCKAGSFPAGYLFLMEGEILREDGQGSTKRIAAPSPIYFEEVLAGEPTKDTVKAAESCVCFTFSVDEFQALLSDSAGLIEGLLRMLCVHAQSEIADPIVRGMRGSSSAGKIQMNLTDKVLLFESYPLFSNISREELLEVAAIASELRLAEGAELFGEMDPPALHAIVSGLVVIASPEEEFPLSATDGDALGLYHMLSGIPLVRRALCGADSIILRVEREDFLDLMLQRSELMRQMLTNLFKLSSA